MKQVFAALVILTILSGHSQVKKFKYIPYSSFEQFGNETKTEKVDFKNDEIREIFTVEYVKDAVKVQSVDIPNNTLVRVGETDVYKGSMGGSKMELYAPYGADM